MAKLIVKPVVTINGVNLTSRFSSCEINSERDVHDVTDFSAVTHKQKMLGLGDGTMSFEGFQDFAAAMTDATLWPIHSAGSEVPITVKATDAAISTTNPEYRMTGVLPSYTPLSGSVGEPSTISIEFENSGSAGITRHTA